MQFNLTKMYVSSEIYVYIKCLVKILITFLPPLRGIFLKSVRGLAGEDLNLECKKDVACATDATLKHLLKCWTTNIQVSSEILQNFSFSSDFMFQLIAFIAKLKNVFEGYTSKWNYLLIKIVKINKFITLKKLYFVGFWTYLKNGKAMRECGFELGPTLTTADKKDDANNSSKMNCVFFSSNVNLKSLLIGLFHKIWPEKATEINLLKCKL